MSFSNDIVKYVTQEFVKFIDTPKNDRKKKPKEQLSYRLFGMIPFSVRMASQNVVRRKSTVSSDSKEQESSN